MRTPIFVRELTDDERKALKGKLRSSDAFTVRRCQMLLASARGVRAPDIALSLSCDDQTVRNAIHDFNAHGLASLTPGSSRPHTTRPAFDAAGTERLRQMIRQSPRTYGKETSVWTLDLLAEVSLADGLTARRVSGETIRTTLDRLGIKWRRAKRWLRSSDPSYDEKNIDATV